MGVEQSSAGIRSVRALNGELTLRTLETCGSSGPLIRREIHDAERLRHELLDAGTELRRFPSAAAGRLLSVWNAYVLQVVGEHLLDAVRQSASKAVSVDVASQILGFLGMGDRWMSLARHTATDLTFRVEKHVHLPAEPPAWLDQVRGPYDLSRAMEAAVQTVYAKSEAVLADCARSEGARRDDLNRLRGLLDHAAIAIEYAAGAYDGDRLVPVALYLRYALRALFSFGQYAAMPVLYDTDDHETVASLVAEVPSRIDAWGLTDPYHRRTWRLLPSAAAAIQQMWAADPSPTMTTRVQAQIDSALRSGAIRFATDKAGERLGCFYRCPWPAVYEVLRPVTIGGTHLLPMQHFTFDALGGAYGEEGSYGRRILVSVFVPAEAVVSVETDG